MHNEPSPPTYRQQLRELILRGSIPQLGTRPLRVWYDGLVVSNKSRIANEPFCKGILSNIDGWTRAYSSRFQLLRDDRLEELSFSSKPFRSVVDKLYRMVVLGGRGPLLFADSMSEFKDLIRLTITCRFGDGPEFLASKLRTLGDQLGVHSQTQKRADDFGYYAIHFTFKTRVSVLRFGTADVVPIDLTTEIQLTTQLQASLRDLTHQLYETRRLVPSAGNDWKWDFRSPFFQPSYTGHTLHLLEGIIVAMKREREGH